MHAICKGMMLYHQVDGSDDVNKLLIMTNPKHGKVDGMFFGEGLTEQMQDLDVGWLLESVEEGVWNLE